MMAARGRHAVLSLTTRFCLPHEGMTRLEFLSRGSAVMLDVSAAHRNTDGPAVVTCQHVACPWLFPRYFADKWDWLQFVSEGFVRHSLQLLQCETTQDAGADAGTAFKPEVLLELPLAQQVHIHNERDLALLELDDAAAVKDWEHAVAHLGLHALPLKNAACIQGQPLLFTGHRQFGDGETEGFQAPKTVGGRFVGRSDRGQEFAWSEEQLEEGMCGGAVVAANGECVGIVEGIVPPLSESSGNSSNAPPPEEDREAYAAWHMRQVLAGHVAFIPSAEVSTFVSEPDDLLLTGLDLPPEM